MSHPVRLFVLMSTLSVVRLVRQSVLYPVALSTVTVVPSGFNTLSLMCAFVPCRNVTELPLLTVNVGGIAAVRKALGFKIALTLMLPFAHNKGCVRTG